MTNNASAAAHSPTVPTRIYKCNALTDIWTGSIKESPEGEIKIGWNERQQRNETKISENCLIPTGLLGSLRWWYEVLVRGLGGYACDPSAKQKECKDKDHCVVCELFGCTGWARKFAFAVLDGNGQIQQRKIAANSNFQLRFTELRPIRPEEWTLLDATLRLIADYGAIGGKTVFKPSTERNRENMLWHTDFGLIKIECPLSFPKCSQEDLRSYLKLEKWKKADDDDFAWASLKHFWFVNNKYLARKDVEHSTFNRVVGRVETKETTTITVRGKEKRIAKSQFLSEDTQINRWLSGWRPVDGQNAGNEEETNESKKIFSFKNPARTFGFVKPGLIDFEEIRRRLENVWGQLSDDEFQDGEKILNTLLSQQ